MQPTERSDLTMKLYTVISEGREKVAALSDSGRFYSLENSVRDMNELITGHYDTEKIISEGILLADDGYEIISPIPVPLQDVICIAKNYYYPGDIKNTETEEAVYFSKRVSFANHHGGAVPLYDISSAFDYETELGIILADDVKGIVPDEVHSHIFGYTIINDLSDRILQNTHKQWYFGKSLDGYTSIGPCIVTADEFGSGYPFHIMTYVNGELRQDDSTQNMIRSNGEIVSELSEYMTLRAGTVIATGTPWGAGKDISPPEYLKDGDIVESVIEGIGTLRNVVKAYKA